MAKRKGKSNASSHHRPDSLSPNRPRWNSQERLLSRLYEPLVLLHTLGSTRGKHTSDTPSRESLPHVPLKELRRIFLNELAYMCDYDKGGETITALGLQSTPQGPIFWLASNKGSKAKTIDFLQSLLAKLMHAPLTSATTEFAGEVARKCIEFANPRIKKYKSLLKLPLRKCISYLIATDADDSGLVEWLQSWEQEKISLELCRTAYSDGKSSYMSTLARLSAEPNYKTSKDSVRSNFRQIRHYIGRLGYHFRAADVLTCCASRLSDSLHGFEVRGVPSLTKSIIPPPDGLTTSDGILVRMLPSGSTELEHYQQALADMESRYQVFQRFLENYTKPDLSPCVHAEIQVLEHFYSQALQFPDDDSYIACSKPACFCCLLYFRNHPGHFVEPESHNKIYLNWRPPDFSTQDSIADPNHQRDILNRMTRDIRKEALRHIHGKSAAHAWHPDSLTGVTQSVQHEEDARPAEMIHVATSVANGMYIAEDLAEDLDGDLPSLDSSQLHILMGEAVNVLADQTDVEIAQSSQLSIQSLVSGSDGSGGVLL